MPTARNLARHWLNQVGDYAADRRRQSPSAMNPLTISILLLVCAFVITVAYVAVDEHV